jgi:N-acetylglucosaminyldiphosphoundecaprenol N-acetyl-beta-D-mannosaminyltransferase
MPARVQEQATLTARDRADVLGCAIDRIDMRETLRRADEHIRSGAYVQHVSINTAKLVNLEDDDKMRAIINDCGIVTADGQGVVWASRLLRDPLPGRVAGIDLMTNLLSLAEERGYGVFILGARREVLETAVENIRARHPRLELSGYRDGYFSDDEAGGVCEQIRASGADILFVAMSSPRKEYFLGDHGPELGVSFGMGVGGSIDVMAGATRRAPVLLQRLGLEWLFRLVQEPLRLGPRYVVTNARLAWVLARALASRSSRAR